MALIKCKECKHEISKKAETCPQCGAKQKKKTSTFTWLVAIFFGLPFLLLIFQDSSQKTHKPKTTDKKETQQKDEVKQEPVEVKKEPTWQAGAVDKDEMSGEKSLFAYSPKAYPSSAMKYPYGVVTSTIGIGCNKKSKWVYFHFSSKPNLASSTTKTRSGYSEVRSRIKWDNRLQNTTLTQEWGSEFIHFTNNASAIANIAKSNEVKLELQWHGEQPVIFTYSLKGSSKAIKEISAKCAKF